MPAPDAAPPATLDDVVGLLRDLVAATRPAAVMLDLRGFARLLGIGESTLEKLRAARRVGPQAVKVGGSLRWHRPEVEAWIANRDHAGDLYDAKHWPAVWRQLRGD